MTKLPSYDMTYWSTGTPGNPRRSAKLSFRLRCRDCLQQSILKLDSVDDFGQPDRPEGQAIWICVSCKKYRNHDILDVKSNA